MRNRQGDNCIWRKAGFTLVETLLVVGILITLLALSVIAVSNHAADLRQLEMDAKAEQIYIAAQNRMTVLRANGVEYKYQLREDVKLLNYVPYDADEQVIGEKTLSYVTSDWKDTANKAAGEILPSGCIDYAVWDNHWIIEYDPIGGTVYAVFYSEKEISYDANYLDSIRAKTTRRRVTKGHVGYYGGDITVDEVVMQLEPYIVFFNQETMSATYVCRAPDRDASQLYFTIEIRAKDGSGGVYRDVVTPRKSGRYTYEYTLLLDDLKSESTRFKNVCQGVTPGKDLEFYVYAESANESVLPGHHTDTHNALFAYDTENGAGADTAVIRYARHLQNLDSASGVDASITKAVQAQDIDFAEEGREDEKPWYLTQEFTPINNEHLLSYNGQNVEGNQYVIRNLGLTGSANASTGLFETLHKGSYQNIYLIGSTVSDAGNAGMLAGSVTGNVTLENCRGYLEREMLVGKDQEDIWVSGNNAGGLVGYVAAGATVNISKCFAATVMQADTSAGGLVGLNEGTLNITGSYADSYITAENVGGLAVSIGTVTLENTYTAGYLTGSVKAAGLVCGAATMKNSYAAISYLGTGRVCTTAESGSADNVLYLQAGFSTQNVAGTTSYSYSDLSDRAAVKNQLGEAFVAVASQTIAYNLMGQGVAEYSFPALSGLPHYGDWDAEFESGKLVYYEVYKDIDGVLSYGFFGANMDALNNTGYAVGDGYGIVYENEPGGSQILYGDNTTGIMVSSLNYVQISKNGTSYRVYQLTKDVVNADYTDFYQKLRVKDESGAEETFYYNPYFAKTVISGEKPSEIKGDIIIRTARQLHLLSLYHDHYAQSIKGKTFVQELDISYSGTSAYDWDTYWGTAVAEQTPIGADGDHPFASNYNGYYHKILNLDIVAKNGYVGLFGYVKRAEDMTEGGRISNVFLIAENNKGIVGYDGGISEPDETIQIGALVAHNEGRIENCAVAGYSTKLYVYNNSNAYLGGLVGSNGAGGEITGCSVSTIGTTLNINDSSAYVGGFVGVNYGYIGNCYTIGTLEVVASKNAATTAAGFAARNPQAQIHNCYCATALTASGDVESCAFVPRGGDVNMQCAYLANGAYFLGGELYAFHSQTGNSVGSGYNDEQLKALTIAGFANDAQVMEFHYHSEGSFQYPAVVIDGQGKYVHYGEWPQEVNMGEAGVFYWEQEYGGNNDGYHLSYLGKDFSSDPNDRDGEVCEGSNLCDSHDDYGNIIRYGYGYYYRNDTTVTPPTAFQDPDNPSKYLPHLTEVNAELNRNMPEYIFVAYESGAESGQLKPVDSNANMQVSLYSGGKFATYTISPFFADAMSVPDEEYEAATDDNKKQATVSTPGTEKNPYMIRSPEQLQFINWNYENDDTDSFVDQSNAEHTDAFTYLRYFWYNRTNLVYDDSSPRYHWNQSHDVDFGHDPNAFESQNFTPIGSLVDVGQQNDANATMAYFAGVYNGQDYTIKNVNIYSGSAGVGLFGVTMGAELRGIALYSEQNNIIQNKTSGTGWYSLGGLVGFAGKGSDDNSVIANCSVAGYTIIDNRQNDGGWGGANIGGLVGSGNMDISQCSAVTNIIIRLGYKTATYNNVRIGGLIGGLRAKISDCYAGGSITSELTQIGTNYAGSVNLWVGGISGGIVMRSNGNFAGLVGGVDVPVSVENCYSYVKLPTPGYNHVRTVHSIASIGEMVSSSFVDYITGSPNMNVQIRNCYCLGAFAVNTTDYQAHLTKTDADWRAGVNTQYLNGNRYTKMTNDHNPYLSYDDMVDDDKLLDYLNTYAEANNLEKFGMVTTIENGAPIHGKYSFPAADQDLVGRDYPFPTILTQINRFSMDDTVSTVNVHYGAWPKDGLYWDRSEVNLDMFVHKDESSYETVKITLNNVNSASVDKDSFTYVNVDGGAAPVAEVVAVSGLKTDSNGVKYFEVTLKPNRKGSVEINMASGPSLQVHVTAEVRIQATPESLKLLAYDQGYEEVSTVLVATNKNGDILDQSGITWTVNQVRDNTIASIADNDVGNYTDVNTITIPVAGHAEGETFFTVDLTYLYNGVLYEDISALVPINVADSGVVGLVGIGDKAQVNVPDGNASESQFQIPEGLSASLVLYSDRGLEGFDQGQLTVDGQPVEYALGERGTVDGMEYLVLVPLLTQEYDSTNVTLSLSRHGEDYTLQLEGVPLNSKKYYTVTFSSDMAEILDPEEIFVVENGTLGTRLPQLNHAVHIFLGWYHDGVEVTAATPITQNMTLTAEWQMRYTVTFNADGGTYNGQETWTQSVYEGNTLQLPEPAHATLNFAGWYIGDTKVESPYTVTGDVELTAKWISGYNVTFDANGGTVNGEASVTLPISPGDSLPTPVYEVTYTIGTLDPFDLVQRFVGWYNGDTPITSVDQVSEGMTLKAEWEYTVLIIDQYSRNGTTYYRNVSTSYTTPDSAFTTQNLNGYATSAGSVTVYRMDGDSTTQLSQDTDWTWSQSGNRRYVTIDKDKLTGPIIIIV